MKYCQFCGAQLEDGVSFCSKCGNRVSVRETASGSAQDQSGQGQPTCQPPISDDQSGLKTAAKVFMIIGCVYLGCFGLIGLAWSIPMTVSVFHGFRDNKPVGVGLKICTLLFVNLIAGILLLCVRNPEPRRH